MCARDIGHTNDEHPIQDEYGPTMAPNVRASAIRPSEVGSYHLIYKAQVVDDDQGIDSEPLWKCRHHHRDPQSAYSCALDWLDRPPLPQIGHSTARDDSGGPNPRRQAEAS